MEPFVDLKEYYKKFKILILGSYIPKNFEILTKLKNNLINRGFLLTNLANDLVRIPSDGSYVEKMAIVLSLIKEEMYSSDFNVFIFFTNQEEDRELFKSENESTIVELMTLLESKYYEQKKNKILAILPMNFSSSMLEGQISLKELNVFEYENEVQIYQSCLTFISQQIIF